MRSPTSKMLFLIALSVVQRAAPLASIVRPAPLATFSSRRAISVRATAAPADAVADALAEAHSQSFNQKPRTRKEKSERTSVLG